MEDEAREFLENLEQRFGGPVGFRTYSTWFASNHSTIREFGVFVYEINSIFHFEDFERKPSLFGFAMKPRKSQPKYVKYEYAFARSDVQGIELVPKSKAIACAEGSIPADAIHPARRFDRLFRQLVTMVSLSNGDRFFFELMDHAKFMQALREER